MAPPGQMSLKHFSRLMSVDSVRVVIDLSWPGRYPKLKTISLTE